MDYDTYKTQFEEFANDAELTVNDNNLSKLARRSVQLEKEADFSLDDIFEELLEVIPTRFQSIDEWVSFIQELANFVFDEKENGDIEDQQDD